MKIVIHDCSDLNHGSRDALLALFPTHLNSELLNYGQGEGQVKIGETVWGLYFRGNDAMLLQFEEGVVSWSVLQELVTAMIDGFSQRAGRELMFTCEGSLVRDHPA